MRLHLSIDRSRAAERLHRLRRDHPHERRQTVRRLAAELLTHVIELNPVDTGRSRAAWVAFLEQLDAVPPTHWKGPHPDPAAIAEGARLGQLEQHDTDHTTDLRISSQVVYATHLEYGTRVTPPFAMLRRALARVRQWIVGSG